MLTPSDYFTLYANAKLTQDARELMILDHVCNTAIENSKLYDQVEYEISVPWPLIAAIHFRECNQSFQRHLHNGDPLTARTLHVPKGRPVSGEPPFSWADSASDALCGFWKPRAWDIAGCLEFCERFNGLGYQKHQVNTPYLWDLTDRYHSGLFTADGSFDPLVKESRPGVVAILKTLEMKGVSLAFTSSPALDHPVH